MRNILEEDDGSKNEFPLEICQLTISDVNVYDAGRNTLSATSYNHPLQACICASPPTVLAIAIRHLRGCTLIVRL